MQNSNLSTKIFPNVREDWLLFIEKTTKDLQNMITTYNSDKQRIRNLNRIIERLKEIKELSKDNIEKILNYKELFMYVDNSLESSFDALDFFRRQDNLDNDAVKTIYERIINSPKIIEMNSEYSSLSIKVQFDRERIKKLSELTRGSKIDYVLIRELVNKYQLTNEQKKNILFYPVVMLAIKQNSFKNSKDDIKQRKEEKEKFYREQFSELCKKYQDYKKELNDLLVMCFNIRTKMNPRDVDMYTNFANNPNEINEYEFSDDIKFKIYSLAFFKIKKDIENFIDSINDLLLDESNLDEELAFFQIMIDEFNSIADKLRLLSNVDEVIDESEESNVFFALDAFNRLIIKEEILSSKNRGSIKALLQKASSINNSKIDGLKTSHMLGVSDAEKLLDKNISLLVTAKLMLAYVMIDKNILIIAGDTTNTNRFDKIVNRTVERNIIPIKRQIALIKENDLDYLEMENRILKVIIGEEETQKKI